MVALKDLRLTFGATSFKIAKKYPPSIEGILVN
jgi:hypothetical protein